MTSTGNCSIQKKANRSHTNPKSSNCCLAKKKKKKKQEGKQVAVFQSE